MKTKNIFAVALITAALLAAGCSKKSDGLQYKSLSGMTWATGYVMKGDQRVMWFQLFDNIEKQEESKQSYASKTTKVNDKYPATVSDSMVWALINDRMEIRLMADSKAPEYKSKEKLLEFFNQFDLAGLEKVSGEKLTGEQLTKYAPKLPMAK